jgi:hypothetical protein
LFAAERDEPFVTAAVLKEDERESHIEVFLARNNGFERRVEQRKGKKDKSPKSESAFEDEEMIKAIEHALNQFSRLESQGTAHNVAQASGTSDLTSTRC